MRHYLEQELFPNAYNEEERKYAIAQIRLIESTIARFFSKVNESNIEYVSIGISHEYRADFLDLLGRYKAFDRCDALTVLPTLDAVGIDLGRLLASKKTGRRLRFRNPKSEIRKNTCITSKC